MKPIQTRWFAVLIAALLVSPTVSAGIADLGTNPQAFQYDFGLIEVNCTVYNFGSMYLYTYELVNSPQNTESASWFSVALKPGVDIVSIGYDYSTTDVVPVLWHDIGTPISSIDAQFQNPIDPGESSTTLFYISSQGPSLTSASLGGSSNGQTFVHYNAMTSPVPEPATVCILAAGACLCLRRRK